MRQLFAHRLDQGVPFHGTRLGALALVLALLPASASAGDGEWTSGGPEGGESTSLVFDPLDGRTVLASASSNAVFRSEDVGETWTASRGNLGLTGYRLAASSTDPTWFAVTLCCQSALFFRSDDGGRNWTNLSGGLTGVRSAGSLAIDPMDSTIVYVSSQSAGIYKSVDSGQNFATVNNGLPSPLPNRPVLEFDPSDPSILYAADGDLFKTTDGGSLWVRVTETPFASEVDGLAIDPFDPDVLLAAARSAVARSQDGGATWTEVLTTRSADSVAFHPTVAGLAFAATAEGIHRSTDGGQSWGAVDPPFGVGAVRTFAMHSAQPSVVMAATSAGPIKSVDQGMTWVRVTPGMDAHIAADLASPGPVPDVVITAVEWGVGMHRSLDRGTSWSRVERPRTGGGTEQRIGALRGCPR